MNTNTTNADSIQIDAACMGQEWRGTAADLRDFAALLAEMSDRQVVAVTDSHNGAVATDHENDIPESVWLAAIARHGADNPAAWNL
jgi:hypothetical protein